MSIIEIFKHRKRFFDLSQKYIGKRYKYWNHDLDKLIYGDELHREISHHHPKDNKYWLHTWLFNNWEEICLDWEAHGSAQEKMNKEFPWARMYVKVILERWKIWKDDYYEEKDYKKYIDFYNYVSEHKENPTTWKL